ncbi:MAG TPA: hypothetical protein VMF66_02785 [Candidatus Acidoferrum sp.]|nr:hypothetical protein [Candidatus Acidoferrum sp.]
MKIISTDEACSMLGVESLPGFIDSLSEHLPHRLGAYSIPTDSGAKCSLSKLLGDLLLPGAPIFIYVAEWGIWPSAENFDLFDGYRRSVGEDRPLKLAPVHVFETSDKSAFVSILSMALYFVWDAKVFDQSGTVLVTFSHDEWVEIETADPAVAREWSMELDPMELEPL